MAAVPAPLSQPRAQRLLPLLGFGSFARKELVEWQRSKRLYVVAVLMLLVATLALLTPIALRAITAGQAPAQDALSADGQPLFTPDDLVTPEALGNVLTFIAGGSGIAMVLLVLASANLLVGERLSGTLAWNLTLPLARRSLLLAKWCVATLLLWLAMSLVPLLFAFALGVPLYGGLPSNPLLVGSAALITLVTIGFGVLLVLFLSLFLSSQGALIGINLALYFAPTALGPMLPEAIMPWLTRLWPTNVHLPLVALLGDQPFDPIALVASVAWFVGLAALTSTIFQRQEVA